ncbi:MAG TPA: diaminopimelate decarboxylase [Anaerohalosphaeraceae bacterium]|jgi:diaminopimelate decarboxylase|nr:diaminopimelate decarboxylase [Anaerohalosphaeraceae bacterium]HRT50205.1 diaminopimelate decarboxylase [Anaerohalosphaeraceae bacterium]HRT86136.1 diaminopimelate decarboxylase [Anaerohalosphaeraceae bacterium]
MDCFNYRNGRLFAEDVDVETIAAEVGTPVYVYSKATFLDHLKKIQAAYAELDTTVCYSIKACGNINILRILAEAGSGFDIVSGGELYRAQQAGADTRKIVYAGTGKTDREIIDALNAPIGYFNIESEEELENLIRLAKETGRHARAALRVNPDVDPKTHRYITTGTRETKFGVDIERAMKVFADYGRNGAVDLCAIHVHLGSGGKTITPYVEAVRKILPVIDALRQAGHTVEMLDLGGGYGADYESDTVPSAAEYAAGIVPLIRGKNLKLILEPGKAIIANAGILLTRTLYTKTGGEKKFVIVDAGMNDLIRPSLYEAFHFIWPAAVNAAFVPAKRSKDLAVEGTQVVDVVGPICEGADFFAKDRAMPPVKRGDLISIFTAGAYGFTMASNYNARPLPAEVLVDGNTWKIIRKRQTYEDVVAPEK